MQEQTGECCQRLVGQSNCPRQGKYIFLQEPLYIMKIPVPHLADSTPLEHERCPLACAAQTRGISSTKCAPWCLSYILAFSINGDLIIKCTISTNLSGSDSITLALFTLSCSGSTIIGHLLARLGCLYFSSHLWLSLLVYSFSCPGMPYLRLLVPHIRCSISL